MQLVGRRAQWRRGGEACNPHHQTHHHRALLQKKEEKKASQYREFPKQQYSVNNVSQVELGVQIWFLSHAHRATGRQCLNGKLKHKLAATRSIQIRTFMRVFFALIMLRDRGRSSSEPNAHDVHELSGDQASVLKPSISVDMHVHIIGIPTHITRCSSLSLLHDRVARLTSLCSGTLRPTPNRSRS